MNDVTGKSSEAFVIRKGNDLIRKGNDLIHKGNDSIGKGNVCLVDVVQVESWMTRLVSLNECRIP